MKYGVSVRNNDNFMEKRVQWVDVGKFLCIMFVFATHLSFCPSSLRVFFTPFFLAFFFFLSGYVYKNKDSFGQFIVKKVRTLLVPWLIFGLLIIISGQIITFNEHTNLKSEIINMFLQIRGNGDIMWFITCLFVAFIPFYFVIKYMNGLQGIVLSFILSVISILYCQLMNADLMPWKSVALPWHIQTIFVAMFLMVTGYYFKLNYEQKVARFVNIKTYIITLIIYLMLIYIGYSVSGNSLGINDYENTFILYWYVTVAVGIMLCILCCKLVKSNKYISFVGANTLTYFGLHGKLESLVEKVLLKIGILEKVYQSVFLQYALLIGTVLVISIILIIPALIINKYFPFILGKWYKSKATEKLIYNAEM